MIRALTLVAFLAPPLAHADPTPAKVPKVAVHPICQMVEGRIRQEYPKDHRRRLLACSEMLWEAAKRKIDLPLTLELAWGESRFSPASINPRSGCSGILQAAPRWWCPNGKREGCDLLDAGLDALEAYLAKHKDEEKALCHFKSGNVCNPVGLRGSKKTMTRVHRLRRRVRALKMKHKDAT